MSPEEFWAQVDKAAECWIWLGRQHRQGYGWAGRELAHRVAWALANGPIPPGAYVLHRCDNPPCVRPEHLEIGSQSENIRQAFARGRMLRAGEHNGRAKLSWADVEAMRALRAAGEPYKALAERFGLCNWQYAWHICAGRLWKKEEDHGKRGGV